MPDSTTREKQVERKIEDFGGLIDEQTARMLLDYEQGLLSEERIEKLKSKLDKLVKSSEEGLILEVEPVRGYNKKDGSRGRLLGIRIALSDGREAKMVFWDKQVDDVDTDSARPGEKVTITNCNFTENRYGLSINTGKGGSLRVTNGVVLFPRIRK